MYRRRNQKPVQTEQPVEKKVEKKEEPVIKYVVQARGADLTSPGRAPMLNTLRNINYFNLSAGYAVSKKYIVDILLSDGFLKGDWDYYNRDNNTVESDVKSYSANKGDWDALYVDTTNYTRTKFAPGDLIMFKTSKASGNLTVGFLVETVYKAGTSTSSLDVDTKLKITPPVELLGDHEESESEFDDILSSFVSCKGNVYMFRKDTTLGDIKTYCSYTTAQTEGSEDPSQLRKLEPTNMSKYDTYNTKYSNDSTGVWGKKPCAPRKADPEGIPTDSDKPTPQTAGSDLENQFNLTSGTIVDGWIIYFTSSTDLSSESTEYDASKVPDITGDVIRAEKVSITTLGNTLLNLGNTFQMPFRLSTQTESSKVSYTGNSLKFASEPLNSVQYQNNYGDTIGENQIDANTIKIYSLRKCAWQEGTISA